ncbi:retrotransposon protein, putative, ty1-copia subclass [Tanacetum coccineum]
MAVRGQNQGKGKNKLTYASKPKIPPPPKREDPAKDSIYHECGETGHWKRNCPQYLAELLKIKKLSLGASNSGIFTIELNTFLNISWIYDIGCGTYICNTTQGLRASRKLKSGALSLYVGNGQREAVVAIGVFHLFSRNNMVYFSAIPRDGIFEIDLSNSYANDSSMYVVSNKRAKLDLDSALLWHCRLRHISKKRIEKLHMMDFLIQLTLALLKNTSIVYPKEMMGYSFYYPPENKVFVSQNAEFLENSLITQEASGSLEYLEIIQEEEMHPSIDTSLNHKEDDLEIDEPQRDLGEPANYKAALLDPESDKWLNAMNVEMQSMKGNEVWDLVDLPLNDKTVGSKWLFKKKADMDGAVHTYKAHFVAKGFIQTYGVNYEETFSPIADIRAIRILIAITTYYD